MAIESGESISVQSFIHHSSAKSIINTIREEESGDERPSEEQANAVRIPSHPHSVAAVSQKTKKQQTNAELRVESFSLISLNTISHPQTSAQQVMAVLCGI